ncbi:hypothetical protein PHLCEN_2v8181 [Hermanssonia centrifuga]|uniref:Uncharacterized protein n=1 Tax=Hermanssonia centrifuga TaxID=98765 RepID=A0A2R6NUE0_9APHY|nr:hypothetical protein PHLCEN_2v8181 [Hermanssonia centrifuga]
MDDTQRQPGYRGFIENPHDEVFQLWCNDLFESRLPAAACSELRIKVNLLEMRSRVSAICKAEE